MDFELSDEQQQFAHALRKWVERAYTFEHRQKVAQGDAGTDTADWAALADLGIVALAVPQDRGGLGGTGVDLMVAMQEMGRALLVEPLFATLLGCAFLRLGDGHADLLERVAAGHGRLACALGEGPSRHDLRHVACRAQPCDGGWRLDGRKAVVLHGAEADTLIVSARTAGLPRDEQGISLFVVPATTPGLARRSYRTFDGQRAAQVELDGVVVPAQALLGEAGQGWQLLDAACDAGIALLCAEAVGVLEVLGEDTLQHLRTRQQFGVAIGKFQALQHRMAEIFIHLEQARSMAILAAVSCDADDASQRRRCVSAAKIRVGEALRFVGQQAVQLHGGLGVSDEMRVAHLFKRATAIDLCLGDADHHLERFMARPDFAVSH